jgi:hypothetical protein
VFRPSHHLFDWESKFFPYSWHPQSLARLVTRAPPSGYYSGILKRIHNPFRTFSV